ncbi:hypothetical protein CFM90_17715 [Ralstonia solanacearum]|nr:hypothetical protein CFM90_17715 [Ralstonia solanacearum]RAA14775.1 hypothetical protein DOT79_16560 [Ralstonia pseudosolanacearum]
MSEDHSSLSALTRALSQFSNPYDRQARLQPALLALVPLVVLVISLYGGKLRPLSTVVSALVACGMLFLLSEFARRFGKAKEQVLRKKWGGRPSTQVLRHSDDTFDPVSTARYHGILATKLNLRFPTAAEEAADPKAADAVYTSAGNLLREVTRDTRKFDLLFKDNISYGFRRNGFGLKPIGLAICFCCIIWVVVRHGVGVWVTRLQSAPDVESFFGGGELTTLGTVFVMLLFWLFHFTEESVREAAFSYARQLVLACETLTAPPKNDA